MNENQQLEDAARGMTQPIADSYALRMAHRANKLTPSHGPKFTPFQALGHNPAECQICREFSAR